MGKKGKVGKGRRDKFYHLAKETGYRSRAAFKLIQLNRKFEFFNASKVLIDLCAAPGGWLQVAAKHMPMESVIIGVDLVPIKPIPKVYTIEADITTDSCKQALKKQLLTWKADVVLNDGAPNLGKNWIHDAYSQAELTLKALRLACDVLRAGGWFVSKVFRSKDYNSLLWVCQQLFRQVMATKPQASRSESAEIFLVCKGYLAPQSIDPKLLDTRYVFSEVEDVKDGAKTNVILDPSKTKRNRSGYEDDATLLYKKCSATDFLTTQQQQATNILNTYHEITFAPDDSITHHRHTTTEIKECGKDLRVLNRKDLKLLLTWWKKMNDCKKEWFQNVKNEKVVGKQVVNEDEKKEEVVVEDADNSDDDEDQDVDDGGSEDEDNDGEDEENEDADNTNESADDIDGDVEILEDDGVGDKVDVEEDEEDEAIRKEIEKLEAEESKDLKRKKKKIRQLRLNLQKRLRMRLTLKSEDVSDMVSGGDETLFDLRKIKSKQGLIDLEQGANVDEDVRKRSLDEDVEDDEEMVQEIRFKSVPKDRKSLDDDDYDDEDDDELEDNDEYGLRDHDDELGDDTDDNDDFGIDGEDDDEDENPLVVDMSHDSKKDKESKKTERWFSKDVFLNLPQNPSLPPNLSEAETVNLTDDKNSDKDESDRDDEGEISDDSDSDSGDSDYDMGMVTSSNGGGVKLSGKQKEKRQKEQKKKKENVMNDRNKDGFEIVPARDPDLDAEGLALGSMMIRSKKVERDMMEMGYHRYTFNDDDHMPKWFVEDEKKHCKRQLPVSKEMVESYKKRLMEINARPIKKVVEARARKKRKALKKMQKAHKKAESVTENADMSSREKAAHLRSIYKRAGASKQKKEVSYVVAKRGAKGKNMRKPPGVKGRYKVVDKRLKKDKRSQAKGKTKMKKGKR